jgi:NADPH2:quinone reductase
MKAVVFENFGAADVLQVKEVPTPTPGSGEVLVRIEAVSVNFADIRRRRNDPYPAPTPLPFVLGSEVSGYVEALGEGVTNLKVGDAVFALLSEGGYAQYAVADARQVLPLPDGFDLDIASTLVVAGVTAYQLIKHAGRLQAGETIFIPGAMGGVGSYAMQLAKIFGAGKIIAGGSTEQRRSEAVARGADYAVDYTSENWPEEVKQLTGGRGADVMLDMAGGQIFHQTLKALAPFGRLIVYGTASLEAYSFSPSALMPLNQTVTGYYVAGWFSVRPGEAVGAFKALVSMVASGELKVDLAERLPLSKARDAHRTMETRQATGKIILNPWLE